MFVETEDAWKAVFEYFPPDADSGSPRQRYYALLAKRQLARWYLANDRIRDAIPIFEELAALDVTDENSRVFGTAGLAIAYYRLGEMDKAASWLSSVWERRDAVDPSLREELGRIARALRND
jgi:tetratricopeptide (TPR) repeat protein